MDRDAWTEDGRARDLARVCLHEYAHLVVARRLGAVGFVRIARIVPPRDEGPHFAGRFELHVPLDAELVRIVALAGPIAELVDLEPSIHITELRSRLAAGPLRLSGADAVLAAGYAEDDVARALALVRELWPTIVEESASRCSDVAAAGVLRWR